MTKSSVGCWSAIGTWWSGGRLHAHQNLAIVAVAVDEGVTPVDARSSSIGGHATFVAVATLQGGEHRADLFALLTH
jgi:hypothetical protein